MPLPPYEIYREQLTPLYHGHALWDPDPANVYEKVSIGDVGYVREGHFVRMFNVLLDWNHRLNRTFCQPESYPRLDWGPFLNIRQSRFSGGDYHSHFVTSQEGSDFHARTPDE